MYHFEPSSPLDVPQFVSLTQIEGLLGVEGVSSQSQLSVPVQIVQSLPGDAEPAVPVSEFLPSAVSEFIQIQFIIQFHSNSQYNNSLLNFILPSLS